MTTKLSLTIDEEVAKKIKAAAKEQNTSVSQLTQAYYESLISEKAKKSSWVDKVAGMVKRKNVSDADLDKMKDEYLRKKHGL